MLARVDLATDAVEVIDRGPGDWSLSPDARWIACFCQRSGFPDKGWYVYPLDRPDLAKPVRAAQPSADDLILSWGAGTERPRYLETVEIDPVPGALFVGMSHQLRARGSDPSGNPVPLTTFTWRSSDTLTAVVDSHGTVLPRRPGRVTVSLSAGGWREGSAVFDIRGAQAAPVLGESWTGNLRDQWEPWGTPQPLVTSGAEGRRALWHRGDSTFTSGVYSRRSYSALRGLGLEAQVSTPIDALQWQSLALGFAGNLDDVALAKWDHRTGGAPGMPGLGNRTCQVVHPIGDGFVALQRLGFAGTVVAAEPWMRSGRWYTLRIQIFPDGSCALAINGTPVARTPNAIPLDRPYRVAIEGKSVRTRILVGGMEVWEGVRGGVDWSILDRRAGAR
jgi:hypothetical protein